MVHYIGVLTCIIFITCLNATECLNYFPVEEINITRYKTQATCDAKYQFKCDNKDCISDKYVCDGIAQCEDGSDETINQCGNFQCQPSTYKCTYGACINISYRCNGVRNCVDNSDEQGCDPSSSTGREFALRPTRNARLAGCMLPNHTPNGLWTVFDESSGYSPGHSVISSTILKFHCKPNYKLYPEAVGSGLFSTCSNGNWVGYFPICISLNGTKGLNNFPLEEKNVTRYRRQATCDAKYQFKCDNNACISDKYVCDGIAQCEDGSDETIYQCDHLQCQPSTFKCTYGACINITYRCNGVKNCVDNSDEQGCDPTSSIGRDFALRPTRNARLAGCMLPNHTPNGLWTVFDESSGYSPGHSVISSTILKFHCKPNYKLYPEEVSSGVFSTCSNGNWVGYFPICIKTCKSILSNERMTVDCYYKGGITNCKDPYVGTRAVIRCNYLYKDITLTDNPQRICIDGDWDYSPPTCDPDCGHKSVRRSELLIGAKSAEKSEYPWQAAIYLEKVYICGGSIISPKVILSAARCFGSGTQFQKYQIGVGKLYRTYEDAKDTDAQYRDVQEIVIPRSNRYQTFDIALVIVENQLQITKFVQLICLDKTQFQDSSLANVEGVITGWVYRENGKPSKILKKLQAKCYPITECQETPGSHAPDKICAGVLNSNQSYCPGEDGAPIAFIKEGTDRFYVRGVASDGPNKPNAWCDASNFKLYTSVEFHKDFILHNLAKYKEDAQLSPSVQQAPALATTTFLRTPTSVNLAQTRSSGGCILPKHPKNGKWSLHDKPDITEQSSQIVKEGTIIKFDCDVGYKFYPEYNQKHWYTECRESKWEFLPECRKTCESRITTDRLIITCDLDGSIVNCENPYVGTIAKMKCAPFYENPSFKYTSRRKHYCLQTGWEYQLPICEPECGITSVQPQRLVIGGNETKSGDYPWQVAIFLDEEQICGGSIISQTIILTAGHCFEHPNNVERYKVGAGKLYRTYKDARDVYAQYSNVKKIEIGELDAQFRGDIAVIILETPFNLTAFVRPVCFDGEEFNHVQLIDEPGIVTGWGYTSETGNSSEVLKELRINYFTRKNCTNHIRHDFQQYYSYDKICAGVLTKDENVCQGDSGGPLVFRHESRYYIRGIVSISASKPNAQCDTASLAFYTSVSFHRRYIEKYVRLYRI